MKVSTKPTSIANTATAPSVATVGSCRPSFARTETNGSSRSLGLSRVNQPRMLLLRQVHGAGGQRIDPDLANQRRADLSEVIVHAAGGGREDLAVHGRTRARREDSPRKLPQRCRSRRGHGTSILAAGGQCLAIVSEPLTEVRVPAPLSANLGFLPDSGGDSAFGVLYRNQGSRVSEGQIVTPPDLCRY